MTAMWSSLTAKIEHCENPQRIVICICTELVKIQLEEVKSRHAVHAWWSYRIKAVTSYDHRDISAFEKRSWSSTAE